VIIDFVTPLVDNTAPAAAPAPPPPAVDLNALTQPPSIHTIAIDPGHGGEDQGAVGPEGVKEKDITLAVARRAKAVIEARLGIRVLLTRDDDRAVDLDARAAVANSNKADLFISLHANGSPKPATRGATIFTLSLDRVGEDARRQSQADSAVLPVFGGGSREVSLVEWELAQARHLDGSNAFAGIVEEKMRGLGSIASVALQRVPMRDLAGTNMPAVLIELGYLSSPDDEKLLTSAEFQNGIAVALTEAIATFRDHIEVATGTPPPTP
jgi:N-acetylmuramoyl-L-alanine amidase